MKYIYFMLTHHYYIYVFVPYVCVCTQISSVSCQTSSVETNLVKCRAAAAEVIELQLYTWSGSTILFPHYTSSVFQRYVMLLCRLLFISLGHTTTYDTPMLVLLETLEKKLREFVVNIPRGRLASTQGGSRGRYKDMNKTSINYFYCILNCWKMYLYISVYCLYCICDKCTYVTVSSVPQSGAKV